VYKAVGLFNLSSLSGNNSLEQFSSRLQATNLLTY